MGKMLHWLKGVTKICPVCSGKGVLPEGIEDHEETICPKCKGTGIEIKKETIVHHQETPCDNPNCHHGKVHKKTIMDHQTLEVEEDCPVCQGLSRILRETTESYERHETCSLCKGSGVVSGKKLKQKNIEYLCPHCHGLGRIFDKKKLLFFMPILGLTFLNPIVAFIVFAAGALLFSLYAIKANKNNILVEDEE